MNKPHESCHALRALSPRKAWVVGLSVMLLFLRVIRNQKIFKLEIIAVRGKFDFSIFNLFFPVNDIEIERFLFLQAPFEKIQGGCPVNFLYK